MGTCRAMASQGTQAGCLATLLLLPVLAFLAHAWEASTRACILMQLTGHGCAPVACPHQASSRMHRNGQILLPLLLPAWPITVLCRQPAGQVFWCNSLLLRTCHSAACTSTLTPPNKCMQHNGCRLACACQRKAATARQEASMHQIAAHRSPCPPAACACR